MDTKAAIAKLRADHPDMGATEISRRVGVSRQRVHQVINELGLPPRQSLAAVHRAEYQCWINMIDRCTNEACANYHRYGGRGIRVCARWMNSFRDFLLDMGPRPDARLSIDRINNDGNYEPGNCRWATRKEQRANQRPARRSPRDPTGARGGRPPAVRKRKR